jgi:hypothetical protein
MMCHRFNASNPTRSHRSIQVLSPCLHMPPKAHYGLKDQVSGQDPFMDQPHWLGSCSNGRMQHTYHDWRPTFFAQRGTRQGLSCDRVQRCLGVPLTASTSRPIHAGDAVPAALPGPDVQPGGAQHLLCAHAHHPVRAPFPGRPWVPGGVCHAVRRIARGGRAGPGWEVAAAGTQRASGVLAS